MNKKMINQFRTFSLRFFGVQSASQQGTTLVHRMSSLIQTTTRPRNATKPLCGLALLITKSTPSFGPGALTWIPEIGLLEGFHWKFLEINN